MNRTILPNRRPSQSFAFVHGNIAYHGSVSFTPNGKAGEIFLSAGKPGSAVEAVARDCAVIASLALQYGVPIEVMRMALTRLDNGRAAGPMGGFLDALAEVMP